MHTIPLNRLLRHSREDTGGDILIPSLHAEYNIL